MYNPDFESEEDVLHHNLMVNYLPTSCTAEELRELFSTYGPIKECIVISDPQNGESRGYGFVRFTSRSAAENAMLEMNGYTHGGKRLMVKKADVGKYVDGAASVYVAGFEPRAGVARDLRRIFGDFGLVLDVTIMDPQEGKSGVAFVKFARYADAISAVENIKEFRKQPLTVKIASATARRATNWQRQAKDYDDTITLQQHILTPESARNVLVLYHYPNADATLAALAAYLYLQNYHPDLGPRDIALIPHSVYRPSPAPDRLPINQRMTDVYLLGYAGSPEYVQQLAHECNSVTVLDHHQATRECFAALQETRSLPPSVEVVLDGDRSAATLAWDYFTERAQGPLLRGEDAEAELRELRTLFEYSEDHALGRHYLPDSWACAYALQKENLNYNILENRNLWRVLQNLDTDDLREKGRKMLKEQGKALDTIISNSFVVQIRDPSGLPHAHFGQCLAVLTDHAEAIGEVAYRLAVKSAETGLRAIGAVALQKRGEKMCKVNLRAVNHTDEDTLQIAEAFDGVGIPAGNPSASSFFVPLESFQGWVVAQTPAPPMPRNLSYAAGQLTGQYKVARPEMYDGVVVDVTPPYFEVALGTTQSFEKLGAPPALVQNMKAVGFQQCPRVAAAVYPIHVHRDVLCLLPRTYAPEHVYLWMIFNGLLRHLDPGVVRLHSLVLCSSIPLAQHVFLVAQAYAKGTGARISCVVEPLQPPGGTDLLECHILVTTPNAVEVLCRDKLLQLSHLRTVMVHDTDRILQQFLTHYLVQLLGRVWAVRKRSGVTVGMYATGGFRPVRQLAKTLMEQDADQHVTVTVTDPREPEPSAPVGRALHTGGEGTFDVKGLLMGARGGAPTGPSMPPAAGPFDGQVTSILSMARAPPARGVSPLGAGFSGNVQTLLGATPAPPPPPPPRPSFPGLPLSTTPPVPTGPFPSMPLFPMQFAPNPFPAMPGAPFLGLPPGFQGLPGLSLRGGPPMPMQMQMQMAMPMQGKGAPGKGGKGFNGKGFGGKGPAAPAPRPPAPLAPATSDGVPRAEGSARPVYPWQR